MSTGHSSYRALVKALAVAVAVAVLSACTTRVVPSPKRSAFHFVQLCDTQLGKGGYEHDLKTFKQAVTQINALKPDFVVICGDMVSRANETSIKDFKRIKAAFTIPCHCVPGNHDLLNLPYERKRGISHQDSIKTYRSAFGPDYYAFDHKGYHFICINTQLWKVSVDGETERHDAWIKKALADASKRGMPIIVVGHHPLYVKDPTEDETYNNLPPAKRKELLGLYEKHGVIAVLSGHLHRTLVNDYKGIQLVTGAATSRTYGSPLGFRLWHVTGSRPLNHEAVPLENVDKDRKTKRPATEKP